MNKCSIFESVVSNVYASRIREKLLLELQRVVAT